MNPSPTKPVFMDFILARSRRQVFRIRFFEPAFLWMEDASAYSMERAFSPWFLLADANPGLRPGLI